MRELFEWTTALLLLAILIFLFNSLILPNKTNKVKTADDYFRNVAGYSDYTECGFKITGR
jgi:hypothetical protein